MASVGEKTGTGTGASRHVYRRSPSEAGGGGPNGAPAPAALWRRAVERYRASVWAPVVAKALGAALGMLVLAGIGASSIARGSGVPAPSALAASSRVLQGGVAPLSEGHVGEPASEKGGEDAGPPAGDAGAADAGGDKGASPGLTADGKVILNQASLDDLRKLPGVGPKRAQAILDLRAKLGGRFRRVTDLLRVKGIGPKSLAKLKERIVLDAPKPAADAGS